MKKIIINFILVFIICFNSYSKEDEKILYESFSGGVVISDDKIKFNIWEYYYDEKGQTVAYPYNGEYEYKTINRNGLTFIKYADQENLMLRSDDYIVIFNQKKYIFNGGRHRPGAFTDVIGGAENIKALRF